MAFYFYLSTKIIMVFITKSYQDLFGVRSYINAYFYLSQCYCLHFYFTRFLSLLRRYLSVLKRITSPLYLK